MLVAKFTGMRGLGKWEIKRTSITELLREILRELKQSPRDVAKVEITRVAH